MRRSSLHGRHASRCDVWQTLNGMAMPARFRDEAAQPPVRLADASCGVRVGLKGPAAAEWLGVLGLPVPGRPNSWKTLGGGSLLCRLGETEFLVEDTEANGPAETVAASLRETPPAGVYPVLRQDVSLLLAGRLAGNVLLETCSLDFRTLSAARGDLALTSMVGVSITILPLADQPPIYRIWADPSFGPYLWGTLLEIVESHGGSAVGWEQASVSQVA